MTPRKGAAGKRPRNLVGQRDALVSPRYAGSATFARLPMLEEVPDWDVAVLGIPFDSGVSYRPGARFGPAHVRQASRLLRPYDQDLALAPFAAMQVVDAGDCDCTPYDIKQAIGQIEARVTPLIDQGHSLVAIGGDHTVALPLLRAVGRKHGPVAVVHFDAHLDTWDTFSGAAYTHGTPFRRASEEGWIDREHSIHVGVRSSIYSPADLEEDGRLGFTLIRASELDSEGVAATVSRVLKRVGTAPIYISIDVDVLDPSHAPATGTPEAGGLTSRELLAILRGLAGCHIVGGDVVEVAPAYDVAEITGVAAAHLIYTLIGLLAVSRTRSR
ncbi:MAG: agmatinase [Candidatus Dormiibacterota bacterium]|jgi:agmatinase